ncbi:hypothetical protein ElyMa_003989900 [Elysia marginata]|uniref:Uncharacterized protein n=1 Tax=Elysia marginata TaxID=1093978 RepID=A0AAV4FYD5_9GAST|nr:hypothetical protein ElyMa_003989900 [Elysia marginata]
MSPKFVKLADTTFSKKVTFYVSVEIMPYPPAQKSIGGGNPGCLMLQVFCYLPPATFTPPPFSLPSKNRFGENLLIEVIVVVVRVEVVVLVVVLVVAVVVVVGGVGVGVAVAVVAVVLVVVAVVVVVVTALINYKTKQLRCGGTEQRGRVVSASDL